MNRASTMLALLCIGATACAGAQEQTPAATTAASAPDTPAPLVGKVERGQVESLPTWASGRAHVPIDQSAAQALWTTPPGATLRIFLGTWCRDSLRELTRFWQALDAGQGPLPFTIEYVAVDRAFSEPAESIRAERIDSLPTFIVSRDGREVGRVVESSPNGIERDVLGLLQGTSHGVISKKPHAP